MTLLSTKKRGAQSLFHEWIFATPRADHQTTVVLFPEALLKATVYCAITRKLQGRLEIMGLLVGRRHEKSIEVVDAYVGDCQSTSVYTELDPLATIKMRSRAQKAGLVIVGQWHYHPDMATNPSSIDDEFLRTFERMGVPTPVQLISNLKDFNLSIMEGGVRRKAVFVIPEKHDTLLAIDLDFANDQQPANFFFSDPWVEHTPAQPPDMIAGGIGWIAKYVTKVTDWVTGMFQKKNVVCGKAPEERDGRRALQQTK